MESIVNFLKKYKIEIVVSIVLASIIFFTTFIYQVPFKSFGDLWSHLASVQELQKPFNQIGDPYFENGPKDPHYGPYFVVIAFISNLTGINSILLLEVSGIISIILLYLTALNAYYTFYPERRKFNLDKIVLALVTFLLWDSGKISYAGYYSLADLSITTLFPHIFAMALFMIGISLVAKVFEEQFKSKKFTKPIVFKYILLGFMAAVILLTHVITGVIFFFSYSVFGLYYLIFKYRFRVNLLFLSNIFSLIIAGIIASIWPYYSILDTFRDLQTVHTDQPLVAIFEVSSWLTVAGIAFIGIVAIFKTKNKLIVFWFIFLLLVLASYLYPIRISSYWRFFPVVLVPLFFLITEWLTSLGNLVRTFILFLFLIFGFTSFVNKVDSIGYRDPVNQDNFKFLSIVPKDKIIFSDPETSYFISALRGNPVLAVSINHWNPVNIEESQIRFDDSMSFWNSGINGSVHAIYAIDKYNIEYVLINERIYKEYDSYARDLGQKYRVQQLYQDSTYLLLKLIKN